MHGGVLHCTLPITKADDLSMGQIVKRSSSLLQLQMTFASTTLPLWFATVVSCILIPLVLILVHLGIFGENYNDSTMYYKFILIEKWNFAWMFPEEEKQRTDMMLELKWSIIHYTNTTMVQKKKNKYYKTTVHYFKSDKVESPSCMQGLLPLT